MALSAKVTTAVSKAFAAAGDIVKTGTLSTKSVASYNFATRSTVSTTATLTVSVIIQSTDKPSGEGFTIKALMKSGINISSYDTLEVSSKSYNIIDYVDNGFTIEAMLTKEV
jgi:hypothetical protein